MKSYFILQNGKSVGPYEFDELKKYGIYRDTILARTGEQSWKRADEFNELAILIISGSEANRIQQTNPPKNIPLNGLVSFGYVHADLGKRFLAALVNGICISIVSLILYKIIFGTGIILSGNNNLKLLILYQFQRTSVSWLTSVVIASIVYPLFCGNIGHRVFGFKVISSKDGSDYKKSLQGALREGIKFLMGMFILPSIWLLFNNKRQNRYELILHTYVVKEN